MTRSPISVHVPGPLRSDCGGASELTILAATVDDALRQLSQHYPLLYRSICDETGALRPHVNLFVNNSLICRRTGSAEQLGPTDVLTIMPAVSGG